MDHWDKIKSKIRVLIVDDSDFTRMHIRQMLERRGIQIAGEAASAEAAVPLVAELKPEIAIVDIVMPEQSGIELTELIHKNYKRTSVIVISSLALEHIVLDSISAGAKDFIQKPFTEESLYHAIEKVGNSIEVFS